MTQLYRIKSSVRKAKNDKLFYGIWIRWQALTVGERFVCANIVLLPVWWVLGLYAYMPSLLLLSVAVYEWLQHKKLRLKRPNSLVISFFAFGTYEAVRLFFFGTKIQGGLEDVVFYTFCPACWLWYIQANKIRIRLEVVAWAGTVSVIQMLGFFLLLQFVLPETIFPQPTLLTMFTGSTDSAGNSADATGGGGMSHLVPMGHGNLFGFNRFTMFFGYPEFFSVFAGFIGIVALDIKNRFWSWLLFLACVFLIFLGATRIVWLLFPLVIALRYLFK